MRYRHFLILPLLGLLAACASSPAVRHYPPQASLQQLQRLPDGSWQAQVRLQNFSTGPVAFRELALKVRILDGEWSELKAAELPKIGANAAEVVNVPAAFTAATRAELDNRLAKSQPLRYRLEGSVRSVDPSRRYELQYDGRLNPAPGLDGVYR
ncbi:MAG: hypothetical protein ACKOXG_04850 [Arenimonas sp.]